MQSKLFKVKGAKKRAGAMFGGSVLLLACLYLCILSANAQETFDELDLNNPLDQLDFDNPEGDSIQVEPLPEPSQVPPDPLSQDSPIQSEPLPQADAPDPVLEDMKIENKVAVFSGIEKITGRIITFDVYINETVQFGALQVTPRVCYTRPVTHKPKTTSFLEVDEITLDRQIRRIFTGWMFAASPALNAVEHPVYDIWLNDCKMESDLPPPS